MVITEETPQLVFCHLLQLVVVVVQIPNLLAQTMVLQVGLVVVLLHLDLSALQVERLPVGKAMRAVIVHLVGLSQILVVVVVVVVLVRQEQPIPQLMTLGVMVATGYPTVLQAVLPIMVVVVLVLAT
jgi:hypothetical protein